MAYNMIILYFRLLYFHVSNSALFFAYNFSTLILHGCSLDIIIIIIIIFFLFIYLFFFLGGGGNCSQPCLQQA